MYNQWYDISCATLYDGVASSDSDVDSYVIILNFLRFFRETPFGIDKQYFRRHCRITSLLPNSHETPLRELAGVGQFAAKITGERKVRGSDFGGLEVACWPLVPKLAGSNPTEAVGFFRAKKFFSTHPFGGEVKPSVPCRRFTACKRSLNVKWKSGILRQNSSAISRPCSSTFGC